MEMIIDFPGGMRVDAHFGPFTVPTDQPPVSSAQRAPELSEDQERIEIPAFLRRQAN